MFGILVWEILNYITFKPKKRIINAVHSIGSWQSHNELKSWDLSLKIHIYFIVSSEPPRVTVNVGSVLHLKEGEEQRVFCDAENYYPLDVDIVWYEIDPAVAGQRVLQHILLSSHKHNQDKTFSVSAFFYLQASRRNSGRQFTCIVSHQSLRMPIKKSFILHVEGEGREPTQQRLSCSAMNFHTVAAEGLSWGLMSFCCVFSS